MFVHDKNLLRRVEIKAHQGEYGAWRKQFCKNYRLIATRICRAASLEQKAYLDSEGSTITCRKGCAYCCSQYISVSLAHGLVIVDYLYINPPKLLEAFLSRYEKWRRAAAGSPALVALEKCTNLSPTVKRTPQELLDKYAELDIPCPFLASNACTIYQVRPICCASHVSVSPPDFCRQGSASPALISEAVPLPGELRQLALTGEPLLSLHQETLPSLVFRLLMEGLPEIIRKVELVGKGGALPNGPGRN